MIAVLMMALSGCQELVPPEGVPLAPSSDRQLPPAVGQPAPEFKLDSLEGSPVSLQDLRGKAVLVNFWATWCPPCREEMPLIQQYAEKYASELVVLGVNEQEGQEVIQIFADRSGTRFPILLDRDGKVAERYFVRNFPTTFFIDAQGIIRGQKIGQLSEEDLQDYLRTIGIEP